MILVVCLHASGLCVAVLIAFAPPVSLAEERDEPVGEYALDALVSSWLGIVLDRDTVILAIDYRTKYDGMEENPFLGLSHWSFSGERNFMNFFPCLCTSRLTPSRRRRLFLAMHPAPNGRRLRLGVKRFVIRVCCQ